MARPRPIARLRPMASLRKILVGLLFVALEFGVALKVIPNSPCSNICAANDTDTSEAEIVCLDSQYYSTAIGSSFMDCVACELNSTAVDNSTGATDVEWALFNMRFALSTCIFGYPEQKVSISSPCQVTCAPLEAAITLGLSNDTTNASPDLGFCNAPNTTFSDTIINECAFCYGFIPQELYLANFLQALHAACHVTPIAGQPFFPNAVTIFNNSVIAGPTGPAVVNTSSGGLHGWKLIITIVLPIVGGLILLALACTGCFFFTRRRRREMASQGRMDRWRGSWKTVRDSWNSPYQDGTPQQPPLHEQGQAQWGHGEPMREMSDLNGHADGNGYPMHMSGGLGVGTAGGLSAGLAADGSKISPSARWSKNLQDEASAQVSPALRDSVGPGDEQIQDPNLHDQFFGVHLAGGDDQEFAHDGNHFQGMEIGQARGSGAHLYEHHLAEHGGYAGEQSAMEQPQQQLQAIPHQPGAAGETQYPDVAVPPPHQGRYQDEYPSPQQMHLQASHGAAENGQQQQQQQQQQHGTWI